MKYILKYISCLIISLSMLSCSDSKMTSNTPIPENLYGTWSDQIGNRHVEFTFNQDNTGSFVYSSRAYFRVASFEYYYQKGVVYCDGAMVHEDGEVEAPWHMELEYNKDHLIPLNSYKEYTFRK